MDELEWRQWASERAHFPPTPLENAWSVGRACQAPAARSQAVRQLEGQSRGLFLRRCCKASHCHKHLPSGRAPPASSPPSPRLMPTPFTWLGQEGCVPRLIPTRWPISPEPEATPRGAPIGHPSPGPEGRFISQLCSEKPPQ